jgi:hypothetical protein
MKAEHYNALSVNLISVHCILYLFSLIYAAKSAIDTITPLLLTYLPVDTLAYILALGRDIFLISLD